MKRYFYVFSVVMLSLLASCAEKFDDTAIWEEIKGLKTRIAALEEKVAENVSAIQSMVSLGSITSYDYNAETGKGVITLVDGKTITIDQTTTGQSLITVTKGDDDVWYWAICRDGVSTPLVVNGKKVPVSVTPALKISEDNVWLISVDGGSTWVNTGIAYQPVTPSTPDNPGDSGDSGESDDSQNDSEIVFFKKAETEGDFLVLTLADDSVIKVAIAGRSTFTAASEALYFSRVSMKKSVAVEMVNVKAYTITEVPEGWKADMEGEGESWYLNVTSPENFTDFSKSGTVKVLAIFENGLPSILSLEVAYEPMMTLKYVNEKVSVTLSEHTGEDFNGYVLAAWKKSDYTEASAVAWLNSEASTHVPLTGTAEYELSELAENYDIADEYVVFASPYLPVSQVTQGVMTYEASDVVYITCKPSAEWKITGVGYDRANLRAVIADDAFYGGFAKLSDWTNYGRDNILEGINKYQQYVPYTIKSYDGPANGFPDSQVSENINPGTDYVIWYLPVNARNAYTENDFVLYEFKTPDISPDNSIAVPTFQTKDITVSGFTAMITPSAGTYKTYSSIKTALALQELSTDDIVRDLIKENNFSEGSAVNTLTTNSYSSDDEVYLLAVSVSEEGGYGTLLKEKVDLKTLVFTEELGVSVSDIQYDLGAATLTLNFTGNPQTVTYFAATDVFYADDLLQRMLALGQYGYAVTKNVSSSGMTIELTGLEVGMLHTFYAVVSDAEGNASILYKKEFTPETGIDYVLENESDYGYGRPTLTHTRKSALEVSLNVAMPSECRKYWLFAGNSEYFTGDAYIDSDKLVSGALDLLGAKAYTESQTIVYEYMNNASRIYMVWLDDQNRYHAIYEYNPKK